MTDKIVIPEFPELSFETEGHIYKLNGIEIPSVSALMKPLSDSFYRAVDPVFLNKAADRGTAVHNAIENYIALGVADIEPAYSGYFDAFLDWWDKKKPVPLAEEARVYHKILRYAGTADLPCLINGALTLVDYKTSAQVNSMLCGVQLEAYDRAFETHGIRFDDRMILHLSKDGRWQEAHFPRNAECWSVMSALCTIRNYMNKF